MIGTTLQNRYRIDAKLGRGGMGAVYRAIDTVTGEPVAVKALDPLVVARDPELLERFTREGEALRQLNHPNIVRMIAAVEEAGQHYLVMEYVLGGSLRDLLEATRPDRANQSSFENLSGLSTARVVEIALDLADALTRAHRLGILHRDLKPENVLLAQDGTPRLADFGLARLAASSRLTQSGMLMGTVDYVSPEACQGEAPDERSDIWSFGVMLFEMLAGRVPFTGDTLIGRLNAILTQPVPDLAQLAPGVSDGLADLVYRMLDKDPCQRIPSVRLIGAELEALLKGRTPIPLTPAESRFTTPTPPAGGPRHNLPLQTTPFVGREAELRELGRLLSDPAVRLVSVVALGGMGKTRLAIEAGTRQLERFAHGVWFVPLAGIEAVEAMVPATAQALGFSFYEGREPHQQLLDYLREKQMLLIFDNFEHLLEGVALVTELLQTAPAAKAVVTTRARLNVQGEQIFPMAAMDLPDLDTAADALSYSAVKLFLQAARRVQPGFDAAAGDLECVTRICRLVGGMPLGILLAAAWVGMLTPAEILAEIGQSLDFLETELRDVPERQRSLRAVFDHSWNLLTEREREVFRGLSVFRSGFTREAAQQVTGASLRELMGLVDKSLLQRAPTGRYELHELLRQFADEKLGACGAADDLRQRHLKHYLAVVESASGDVVGRERVESMRRLAVDWGNFLAALEWSLVSGDTLSGFRLFHGLPVWWRALVSLREERVWLERLLAAAPQATLEHARGLRHLARVLHSQGEYKQALAVGEESLALFEALGDREGIASATFLLSWPVLSLGDSARARSLLERSLRQYRELDRPREVAYAIMMLGEVARSESDLERARDLHEQSVALLRELNDSIELSVALYNLGSVLLQFDEISRARAHLTESLSLVEEHGETDAHLTALASMANRQGWPLKAATLAGAADAERAAGGRAIDPGDLRDYEELMSALRAQLSEGALAAAYAKGQALSREAAVALATSDEP